MTKERGITRQNIGRLFATILMLLATYAPLAISAPAHAEESRPDIRIGLIPVSIDVAGLFEAPLEPGTTYADEEFTKLTVFNSGNKAFDFKLTVEAYTMTDSSYGTISSTDTMHTEMSRWISFEKTIYTLQSDERVEVPFEITVPKDAPGGSQYAIIYAEAIDSGNSDGVVPISRAGIPIHALIDGETREAAEITKTNIRSFLFAPPITTTSSVKNSGNVDVMPEYAITVTNIFGKQVHYDKTALHIQPDTTREVELTWQGAPMIGVFKVKQTVTFVVGGETVSDVIEKTVWIIPLFVVVFIPLAFAGLILLSVRKHKIARGRGRYGE
jgi:hypothetical protein